MKKYFCLLFFVSVSAVFSQDSELFNSIQNDSIEKEIEKLIDSSNTYYYRGNYVRSMEFNVRFLNKSLEINSPRYITQGYRFLGYDYLALKDSALAKKSFVKSEKYARLSKNDTALAKSYMDLANLYSSFYTDYDKAIKYHDKSIALFEKVNDSIELAKAHYNTIQSAVQAKDYAKVKLHLLEMERYKKFQNQANIYSTLNAWGIYYLANKNYKKADSYFKDNISAISKEEFPIELYLAYKNYSVSLFEQKKYKEAFAARDKYEEIHIETLQNQINSESQSVTAKYQIEEYKKDVEAAELQNMLQAEIVESKGKMNTFLTIVTIAGLIMLIVLFFAFRKRKELVNMLKIKNKEYLEAKEQSEKLALSKSNFFSTVSHELRTPLYGVIGLSTILLEDKSLKNHEKDLKSLKFSADYLLALINDVLQLNKIDSNNASQEDIYFDLRELMETIVSTFNYMSHQNNNKIFVEIDDEIPQVLNGNSMRLSQVLMNLVGNASKFTENGTIHLTSKVVKDDIDQQAIKFTVKDNGIGIAEEKQANIFDEFSQIENANYSYQGTGLGLPIVRKLLHLSDSKIELKSELGKGSEFTFKLTFKKIEKEVATQKPEEILDDILLKNKNILIVDDNRINQTVTKKILERHHVICDIAENGKQAVEKASKGTYSLILMDLNMPVMDGFEATKQIRSLNHIIPIIALTAVEVEEVRNKIFEHGMDDIIVKPYDVNKFIQTILKNFKNHKNGGNNKHRTLRAR